ncbi:BadF/BadG/BcrA/BcrD ATPase family protein [Streptomyces coacervatus]|uniref:BadF/BadG/BcrA/BcrD ATPase family protein n=1 Tax=Streptomyces coacervatus TaxID=647381 RepID=A0ABP7H7I8_9ACTN|nr:BadF/BadG/BcrA/BcrD ATPase family protein [Streptomyces coacervatus]MDF2267522.1 BadF/BadG/BcrA/BcrD ATPase family protein [Streptomyces coacervatus]
MNQASGGSAAGPGPELVVGLDAGGTRTRAVLATAADGRLLGEGAAGPGNALTVPLPQLTDHLAEAVAGAVPEAARRHVVAVGGGFAGATGADEDDPGRLNALTALTAALRRLGIGADSIAVGSDIEAAFASAPGAPADGLALVAGTGAVAMRITDRRCRATVDGDGWLLGDDGSGFWIGREAVRAALRMADGRGGATVLVEAVGQALGLPQEVLPGLGSRTSEVSYESPGAPEWSRTDREAYRMHLLPVVMAEPPTRLARFAPLVAEAARDKDPVAQAILDEAVDQLAHTVAALDPRPGERIVATGGLLGPDGPLTAGLAPRLRTLGLTLDWVADGCRGAVALARLESGRRL